MKTLGKWAGCGATALTPKIVPDRKIPPAKPAWARIITMPPQTARQLVTSLRSAK